MLSEEDSWDGIRASLRTIGMELELVWDFWNSLLAFLNSFTDNCFAYMCEFGIHAIYKMRVKESFSELLLKLSRDLNLKQDCLFFKSVQ